MREDLVLIFFYVFFTSLFVIFLPTLRNFFLPRGSEEKIVKREIKRYDFFDFLRGLAILAVIVIHVGEEFLFLENANQVFLILVNNISRFAVPFFLISSGVLLLREKSLLFFYQKKIIRSFLPFFLVSLFLGLYYNTNFLSIIWSFFTGSASLPYYFMSVLLQLYLVYPVLEKFSNKKYFLHISFLITMFSFFAFNYWTVLQVPLFLRFFFFFAYGISQKDRFLSNDFYLSAKEKIICFVFVLWFLFYSTYFQIYFYNMTFFYSIALFNLVFLLKDKVNKYIFSFFVLLGKNSLWIFLLHYLVIQVISSFVISLNEVFYWQYLILLFISSILSIIASFAVKNIYKKFFSFVIK